MQDIENVVVLTIDALRADHLGCHGHDRSTTPNIDALAAENVRYIRTYSVSSHTREAAHGLLTGDYPDVTAGPGYSLTGETVATHLTGVETGAFHSNPYLSRAFGFDRDFDRFDDDLHLSRHKYVVLFQRLLDKFRNRHYARASTINERSIGWIDGLDGPFFCYNHYMDVHGPYEPPEPFRSQFFEGSITDNSAQKLFGRAIDDPESITAAERQTLLDLYDGEIAYVDEQVGAFVDSIRELGLWDETLLILTADHGEEFGEHGRYAHPHHLTDELVHVPMIVAGGGIPSATVETPASTLDVVPTVLEALAERVDLAGESLLELVGDESRDRVVFSQVRDKDEPVRRFSARDGEGACFVERSTADGQVRSEECAGASTGGLREALMAHSAERIEVAGGGAEREGAETTQEIEDRLEALGYR